MSEVFDKWWSEQSGIFRDCVGVHRGRKIWGAALEHAAKVCDESHGEHPLICAEAIRKEITK
jgi:hypothetical protein